MQRFFVEPHQIDRDRHEIRITGNDVYRKEMAKTQGKAYTQYKDGVAELRGPAVRLTCSSGSITVAQLLAMKSKVDSL